MTHKEQKTFEQLFLFIVRVLLLIIFKACNLIILIMDPMEKKEMKQTVVVATKLIASSFVMSLFVIVTSLEGSQTFPCHFSGRIIDNLLVCGHRFFFFSWNLSDTWKYLNIHFDHLDFDSIHWAEH